MGKPSFEELKESKEAYDEANELYSKAYKIEDNSALHTSETIAWVVGGIVALFVLLVPQYGTAGNWAATVEGLMSTGPMAAAMLAPGALLRTIRKGIPAIINARANRLWNKKAQVYAVHKREQEELRTVINVYEKGIQKLVAKMKDKSATEESLQAALVNFEQTINKETKDITLDSEQEATMQAYFETNIDKITKGLSEEDKKQLGQMFAVFAQGGRKS